MKKHCFGILLSILSQKLLSADFEHNLRCISPKTQASFEIYLDKSEFPNLGRPGGIHLNIQPGSSPELQDWVKGHYEGDSDKISMVTRTGAAGQVGNSLQQDAVDWFRIDSNIQWTNYVFLDSESNEIGSSFSYICAIKVKKLSTGEIVVRITGGGDGIFEFEESDCTFY